MKETFKDVSAKGYYYNLNISPYEWKSPYGDIYKLPSRKRIELMDKRAKEELRRLDHVLARNDLKAALPSEIVTMIRRCCIEAVYRQIVE